MQLSQILSLATLAQVVASAPAVRRQEITAASQLLQIAPGASSCDGAEFPDECRTAAQAAPFLIQAMADYKLYAPGQIAAVLSLIAFESGDFKYNRNHFPGRPGQGTRNMMMPQFVALYAKSIPALASQPGVATVGSVDSMSADQLNALLDLVLPDQYSFASGAWFLTSQCDQSVAANLASATDDAYLGYMRCIGTEATAERLAYWQKAKTAFGL